MTAEDGAWRSAVGNYLRVPAAAAPEQSTTPLALQFDLRTLVRRTLHRWNGPLSTSAKAVPATGLTRDHRLGLRPVTRTGRGWARGPITWTNLQHLANRLQLHPEQHRWACEFGALYRAPGPTAPGRDPDWVFLDDFTNPALWALLDQAAELGIALVGTGSTEVRRAEKATVGLDLTRDRDGARLAPQLSIDGVATGTRNARPIGNHGLYLLDHARQIVLAPVPEPLTAEQLAVLGEIAEPVLQIPGAGVEEFLADYLPGLRDRIDVDSSDRSVQLPAPRPARLVLTLTHRPEHTLELRWQWEHRRAVRPPLAQLLPAGSVPADWLAEDAELPLPVTLRGIEAAECVTTVLPRLAKLPGLRVETVGQSPRYRELTGTPKLTITTVPTEKHDWFSLGVTVTVDGITVPFTPLFTALARGRHKLLLTDGSYLSLRHPALHALAELVQESAHLAEWEPTPTLSAHQAATLWTDFEDLADEAVPATAWRSLLAEVGADRVRDTPPPAGLAATLRPYQREGFSWLTFLWRHRLGGVLADDMGLGKTVQCLALMQHAIDTSGDRPFLVVAPTSVVPNWVSEAARFTPGLLVRSAAATEAAGATTIAELAAGADIVVTSYALLRLDFAAYQRVAQDTGWAGMFLDEAQFVKNPASMVHQCALDLKVGFKLAITGTPLENSLADLQALFAIVAPGLFASRPVFLRRYVRPIEQPMTGISSGVGAGSAPEVAEQVRAQRLAQLRRRIRPFLLRRTKDLVAADLPPKQEQVLRVDLAPGHRDLYELHLQAERRKVLRLLEDEDKRRKFIVFRSLTLLRLLALHPGLIGQEHAGLHSAKLEVLLERLADVIAEGHRALVFSQFTRYLNVVAERLEKEGISYSYLDGSTRNRKATVDGFATGAAPVFLISLKAGGFGINLTEADYVFLLDPWWNPASETQAIDRTHRIGQRRPVTVYRLVAADTIEEKVMALRDRKAALFDAVVDDGIFGRPLADEDLRELLG